MKLKNYLITIDEVNNLISQGKVLTIAGDRSLLQKLEPGNWIAGSIPYFMSPEGVKKEKNKVLVTDFTDVIEEFKIKVYPDCEGDRECLEFSDRYKNGFTFIIIPAFTKCHFKYAFGAFQRLELYEVPTMGWISGADLDRYEKPIAGALNVENIGETPVALHIKLKENLKANISILNLFEYEEKTKIEFLEDSFEAKECIINGQKTNLYEYIKENEIDIRLPLVGDFFGVKTNVSFRSLNEKNKSVSFYAPLKKGITYYFAKSIKNYAREFNFKVGKIGEIDTSVNCILNYTYANLEGKALNHIYGPFTFGEIAYILVNQTLVYLRIEEVK